MTKKKQLETLEKDEVDMGKVNGVQFVGTRHVHAALSGDYSYYVKNILTRIPETKKNKIIKVDKEYREVEMIYGEKYADSYYYKIDFQDGLTARVSITPDRDCNEVFRASLWRDEKQQGKCQYFELDSNKEVQESERY